MKLACIAVFAATMAALSVSAFAQGLPTQKVLTVEVAETIAHEAMATCRANAGINRGGYTQGVGRVTVTVVDSSNQLKAFLRDDGATMLSAEASPMKAKTVIDNGPPSGPPANGAPSRPPIVPGTLPDTESSKGGLPIKVGDQLIGAVAVSGAGPEGDTACAKAGLAKVADKLR
jgi:uncharacterized protein GlcG (DUF336 family)